MICFDCKEEITDDDYTTMTFGHERGWSSEFVHRSCVLRDVAGGIGHHEDHEYWCKKIGDPDGGRTRRQSAIEVDALFARLRQEGKEDEIGDRIARGGNGTGGVCAQSTRGGGAG